MRINDLKIGTRLRIGFLTILAFVIVLSVICVGTLKTLSGLTTKLYMHPYAVTVAILNVESEIIRMHRSMKDVAISKTPAGIDKALALVDESEKAVFKNLDVIFERFLGDKKDVEALKKLVVDWKPIRDEVASLMRKGDRAAAGAVTREKGARYVRALDDAIHGFEEFAAGKADAFYKGAEKARSFALKEVYLMIALTMAAGTFLSFFLTRGITLPIGTAVAVADRMASGDLSGKIETGRKDEVGMLLSAMDTMATNLGGMIRELQLGSETLVDSSSGLTQISSRMAENAEGVSGKSGTVSVASEQMSSNMNSVAAAMEQASTNVTFVASAVEEMSATISEISQNSGKARAVAVEAASHAENSSSRVDELGRAADEIGKVTEVISEISEQTNLLALNATIEAARAGDAGKGFAVVAGEIKALAAQTADATKNIREKIEGIQSSTSQTVGEIARITQVIREVNEMVETIAAAVEEQSVTTREIASNISQASDGMTEVSENVSQTSQVAGEVAREIVDVNTAADEMTERSGDVSESARVLSELSGTLQGLTARFSV